MCKNMEGMTRQPDDTDPVPNTRSQKESCEWTMIADMTDVLEVSFFNLLINEIEEKSACIISIIRILVNVENI